MRPVTAAPGARHARQEAGVNETDPLDLGDWAKYSATAFKIATPVFQRIAAGAVRQEADVPPERRQPVELMWAEEVAAFAGIPVDTVYHCTSVNKRRAERGKPPKYSMPLPVGYANRKVPTRTPGTVRTTRSPQWDRAQVVAWREGLDAVRSRAARARTRARAGKFAATGRRS